MDLNEVWNLFLALLALLGPVILYIFAGYYAANSSWCYRKMIISLITGLIISVYAMSIGLEQITETWLNAAFNSGSVIGFMYIADRVIKGVAKRKGIEWLYTDNKIEEEVST